ncbi:MAG TPA: hypothetical protein VGJ97_04890 [Anaerolineaceae bacterium]|jgi:hypothetical protein
MVDNPKQLSFLSILPTAVLLVVIGWGGLAALVLYALPTLGPRWLFFFLGVVALTGTSMPVVYFFNRRFPSTPPAEPGVLLRQSLWLGVYGSTLAWLQLGRMLTFPVAGIIVGVLILVEGLLRMREISRWKPGV